MSQQFRELLQKVGSGQHTHQDLTRPEAALAARLMLTGEATPAQIGAFLIAHRIKRPTGQELAGMLDTYDEFGQRLAPLPPEAPNPLVFGVPYDGRSRTAPVLPLVALLLAVMGQPVILHGADTMPTKYGLPLVDIWAALGLDFRALALTEIQSLLQETHLTFYYTPRHFLATLPLTEYREQIGKRPPLATLELIWSPYAGPARLVIGYVHPPTEKMIHEAFQARGTSPYTLVKGLEGSCDLRLSQTTIVALPPSQPTDYLKLDPYASNMAGPDCVLTQAEDYYQALRQLLYEPDSAPLALRQAFLWNGGFYLWHAGLCTNLQQGLELARQSLQQGALRQKWQQLQSRIPIS
ncbi:hypothetical protein [Synechocystis sp. LKSZ1]|uniref:hypothetical protein n=1 Tax=Synechocystis sp. LKSZ1 TaxID=3144951 RepID=UPI00336BAFC2